MRYFLAAILLIGAALTAATCGVDETAWAQTMSVLPASDSTLLLLEELVCEEVPPTLIVMLSVDLAGRVQDARVLPSLPEPTAAQKALALEYARTFRFSGRNERFRRFEVPVTIYVAFGTPKER